MDMQNTFGSISLELQEVDDELKKHLEMLCGDDAFAQKCFGAFFHRPGKKLRPGLTILSGYMMNEGGVIAQKDSVVHKDLIKLAMVTELVHSASLMHDDVLDSSTSRRGKPSMNAMFGNRIAVLAGDIIHSHAFKALMEIGEGRHLPGLVDCVTRMCRAEIRDLSGSCDFDDYLSVVDGKTASLMQYCCSSGGLLARGTGADGRLLNSLSEFGRCFGLVYQLTDDLSDHDSEVVNSARERVAVLADEYEAEAAHHLSCFSDSIYKAGLGRLLADVGEARRRAVGQTAGVHAAEAGLNHPEERDAGRCGATERGLSATWRSA